MSVEEVRGTLEQALEGCVNADSLLAQADRYVYMARRIGGIRYDTIRTSGGCAASDRLAKTVMQLVEAEEHLRQAAADELEVAKRAEVLIKLLGRGAKAAILRRRYLVGESWRQISKAKGIGYDARHCMRLRDQAIEEIARIAG